MGFKVAVRHVLGRGAYQVVMPIAGGTPTPPPATFLAFQTGRHIGNWR